jgi:NADPH2 dehydrogenase
MATDRLFQPLKLGNIDLAHRMVMAPLTRFRADDNFVPALPLSKTYYEERACVPGTLLITEATFISPRASGYQNAPGIWNSAQKTAWKDIVNAVQAKGSFIFLQLWALGRVAPKKVIESLGHRVVSSSARVLLRESGDVPHALSEDEIKGFVQDYANAAENAIEAGFDGVEIHGASGYLIDQFWQDTVWFARLYHFCLVITANVSPGERSDRLLWGQHRKPRALRSRSRARRCPRSRR